MSAGAENDLAVAVAEQFAPGVNAHRVGGGFLDGEGHFVFDVEHLFEHLGHFLQSLFEKRQVFLCYGEVEFCRLPVVGIEGALHDVLVESRAHEVAVDMEIH